MTTTRSRFPWLLQGDVDPSIAPGVPAPIGWGHQNTVTGAFSTKIGPLDTDWQAAGGGGSVFTLSDFSFINLIGSHDDVDLWSGGPITTFVEVDLVGGGGCTITGIDSSQLDPTKNTFLWLWNGGGGTVPEDTFTLRNQNASSLPANRIWTPNGKDLNIPNNDGVLLVWVGDSWITFCGSASMVRAQELSLDPVAVATALVSGSTNSDYDPFTAGGKVTSYVRQDVAAPGVTPIITGISAAGAPNSEGRVLVFTNISTTASIAVLHNSGLSSGANRILCPNGSNITLLPMCTMTLIYDLDVAIWRVVAVTGPAASGKQVFRVTRQVGDTDTITVNAGRGMLGRSNTNYNAQATMGANSLGLGIVGCDPADYQVAQFKLRLTAAWAAGDSALITIEDLT